MNWLSKYMVVLYLSAIFAAGAVSGWVVGEHKGKVAAVPTPRPEDPSKSFKERVHSRLQLTDEQQQKVDAIIDKTSGEIQAIRTEHMKSCGKMLASRNAQIKGLLTSEQQKAFAQLEKERFEPWRAKDSGHKQGPWAGKGRSASRWDKDKNKNPAECVTNAPVKDGRKNESN